MNISLCKYFALLPWQLPYPKITVVSIFGLFVINVCLDLLSLDPVIGEANNIG